MNGIGANRTGNTSRTNIDLDRVVSTILKVNGVLNSKSKEGPVAWCHAKVDHLKVCCWFKDYEASLTDEQLAEFEKQSASFHGPDSELLATCDKLYEVTCVAPDTRKVCGEKGLCDFMPVCASYRELPPEAPQGMLLPHCGDAPSEGVADLWESEASDQGNEMINWFSNSDEPAKNASDLIEPLVGKPHANNGLHWKGILWDPHKEVVAAYEKKEEAGINLPNFGSSSENETDAVHEIPDSPALLLHRASKQHNPSKSHKVVPSAAEVDADNQLAQLNTLFKQLSLGSF